MCVLLGKIWLLCFLLTLLLVLHVNRRSDRTPEDMDGHDWLLACLSSFMFPLVWWFTLVEDILPVLLKERQF